MNESYILQMRDPWSLMYSEYEQDFIDALREKIGPKHPLYNQEVYAIAVRRNPEAVLYHAFNDGFMRSSIFPMYQRAGGGCRRQRYSATIELSVKRLPPITRTIGAIQARAGGVIGLSRPLLAMRFTSGCRTRCCPG
jgi:hypothetical protein